LGVKAYPELFDSEAEITKKLRDIFRLLPFTNARFVARLFYDILRLAYYQRERKTIGTSVKQGREVVLSRKEMARLLELGCYHHLRTQCFTANHELTQCFGSNFGVDDAWKFYEHYLEDRSFQDRFGRSILMGDEGIKFMYKDRETERHTISQENYLPSRGKRLPWIKHVIVNSTETYERIDRDDLELMFMNEYSIDIGEGKTDNCYWVLIARKYSKDQHGPFRFKTAFPIFRYNDVLRRLTEYRPAQTMETIDNR